MLLALPDVFRDTPSTRPSDAPRWWDRLTAEFELGKFTIHDLRATAIVWAVKAGVPISTVRDIAGHSSLAVTNVYARAARNDMQDANQTMTTYLNAYARRTCDEQEAS